jgi:hypothetical protein
MRPGRSFSVRSILWLGFLLLAAAPFAPAQTAAPSELIDQLVANAAQYRASLPSLTADEAIDSKASFMGMFPDHAHATGTFRVLRTEPGAPLQESRQITILNGKPVEPGRPAKLPATLFDGFGRFQEMFFTAQHRNCFDFILLPESGPAGTLKIAISVPAELPAQSDCRDWVIGLTGLALVDPAARQLVHVERTIPEAAALKNGLAPFASVDLASTKVGDQTFWLPATVTGRVANGKIHGEFIAHYSNYHRYTASITLLPGATEVEPTPDDPPAPPRVSTPH